MNLEAATSGQARQIVECALSTTFRMPHEKRLFGHGVQSRAKTALVAKFCLLRDIEKLLQAGSE